MRISKEKGKQIHLSELLLHKKINRNIDEIVKKIGYIQLDSISVIARSQELVLHARSLNYKKNTIWNLLEDSTLFEAYAHARSLVHVDEFPYYYSQMVHRRDKIPKWYKFIKQYPKWPERVLTFIEENGEISTKDVPIPDGLSDKRSWSSYTKSLLDYLARRGYIMVKRRDKFTNVYFDLTDRIIDPPDYIYDPIEIFWYEIEATLKNLGIATMHRLLHYRYNHSYFTYNGKKYNPRTLIRKGIKENNIEELKVEGSNKKWYKLQGYDIPNDDIFNSNQVFLLSPFDNALWSRESLIRQYEFDYKFEGYTPKKDRVYGFYSLPILYSSEFVGKVDPKLDRQNSVLYLKSWNWEEGFNPDRKFWEKLSLCLETFKKFHTADTIEYGDLESKYLKKLQ